jgi:hypothetical protein
MNTYLKPALNGIAMAFAAASFAASAATEQPVATNADASETVEMVHCSGVNQCKGHNDCKTADNACKGQAACKGQGFVGMPAKACADAGGTVKDDWRGEIAKAELTQCFGINVCKGHNDCKTADNACKGQAACKGQGFIMTTPKSCADIGGTDS